MHIYGHVMDISIVRDSTISINQSILSMHSSASHAKHRRHMHAYMMASSAVRRHQKRICNINQTKPTKKNWRCDIKMIKRECLETMGNACNMLWSGMCGVILSWYHMFYSVCLYVATVFAIIDVSCSPRVCCPIICVRCVVQLCLSCCVGVYVYVCCQCFVGYLSIFKKDVKNCDLWPLCSLCKIGKNASSRSVRPDFW